MIENTELKDFLAKMLTQMNEISEENARLREEVDAMRRNLEAFMKSGPRNPNPPPRYPGYPPDVPTPRRPIFPDPYWMCLDQ